MIFFDIFCRFLKRFESDKVDRGIITTFSVHFSLPMLTTGRQTFQSRRDPPKVAKNHLDVLKSYTFYLPHCTAEISISGIFVADFYMYMALIYLVFPSDKTPKSSSIYEDFIAMWNPHLTPSTP